MHNKQQSLLTLYQPLRSALITVCKTGSKGVSQDDENGMSFLPGMESWTKPVSSRQGFIVDF